MHARAEDIALTMALAYMRYVQSVDPALHEAADGSPSIMKEIQGLLSGVDRK